MEKAEYWDIDIPDTRPDVVLEDVACNLNKIIKELNVPLIAKMSKGYQDKPLISITFTNGIKAEYGKMFKWNNKYIEYFSPFNKTCEEPSKIYEIFKQNIRVTKRYYTCLDN